MNGICFPSNVGCSLGSSPYAYDPAGAKRLLAEAGLPDGFDMELTTYTPIREIGEAVAGQLRAVGIRASDPAGAAQRLGARPRRRQDDGRRSASTRPPASPTSAT